jgi:hypothetical protein
MFKTNLTDLTPRREKFKKVIQLPSGGFANRAAFPDGKIIVFPWDSSVDAWLTETSLKAAPKERDQVLFRLLEKVCNLSGCKLGDFVLGDVNAVLMTARSIQNACHVEYVTTCPTCGQEEADKVMVPEELALIGGKDQSYPGTDTITLPVCKDVVELRPLCIRDEIDITGRSPESKALLSDHIAHLIAPVVAVNSTQPERIDQLVEWYMALPPHDARELEEKSDQLAPHLSQELPQKCDRCGNIYNFQLRLDQEFFRSGRSGQARRALAANL